MKYSVYGASERIVIRKTNTASELLTYSNIGYKKIEYHYSKDGDAGHISQFPYSLSIKHIIQLCNEIITYGIELNAIPFVKQMLIDYKEELCFIEE